MAQDAWAKEDFAECFADFRVELCLCRLLRPSTFSVVVVLVVVVVLLLLLILLLLIVLLVLLPVILLVVVVVVVYPTPTSTVRKVLFLAACSVTGVAHNLEL